MKTLVLGLGNSILTDDGVGPQVARELEGRLTQPEVTIMEGSLGGLSLLDLLAGYDQAVIIDAIETTGGKAGQIYRLDIAALDATRHAASPHDVNFATALELGKQLNMTLPQKIDIFAVEVSDTSTFSEKCTPEVQAAIPRCVEMIIHELEGGQDA